MSNACFDPATDAATYRQAARENRDDPLLSGSLLLFPNYGQLVMTGDLHGHQRNLERLQTYCDLGRAGARHVILHELIHEETCFTSELDRSHELLLQAARWKCEFPEQVHFLLGNHELAQLTGREISKGGRILTTDFCCGVEQAYGEEGGREVMAAILDFLSSFPLAGRTTNRIFLSHSLPGVRDIDNFDPTVFTRPLVPEDLGDGGSVTALVWGRRQGGALLSRLSRILDADLFICGHQPQETGYHVVDGCLLIIASDHNHGVFVPFDLRKKLKMPDLLHAMRPLASIA
ncbi:MAG: metallophosphoesterase [Phycisphaerae bacterium]|nr:metallophosphoesterase [Phycisphaerae bacterium]